MKIGNKVGIVALAAYSIGDLIMGAMWHWINFPKSLENTALGAVLILSGGGFFLSFYAAFKGSRWWLLIPLSLILFLIWFAGSGNMG
jgi:hypothetical protein